MAIAIQFNTLTHVLSISTGTAMYVYLFNVLFIFTYLFFLCFFSPKHQEMYSPSLTDSPDLTDVILT